MIPNSAIYQGSYVYTVEDDILRRRDIEIAWQNDIDAVVDNGLELGMDLVMTPLGQVTSGIRVSVLGAESRGNRRTGPGGRNNPGVTQ